MLWTPHSDIRVVSNVGIVGENRPGTGVVSNATTLLDGAVVECISAAANNQESWGIAVSIDRTGTSTVAGEAKMTILIGGATDDVLIPDLICGYATTDEGGPYTYFFPLHVPGGVRIAAFINSVR